MRITILQSVAPHRLRTGLGVALIAAAMGSALALLSCGVLSSGECADKATCIESDAANQGEPFVDVGVAEGTVDVAVDRDGTLGDGPDGRSDAFSQDAAGERSNPDAGHDVELPDAGDAAKDGAVSDATAPDVDADASVNPIFDAFADVPSDAIFMGDTAACGPCTNACIPSFVQCCIGDGGCGCIEFFFPVLCQ